MQSLSRLDQYALTMTPSTIAQVDSHTSAISHHPESSQVPVGPRKPLPSGSVADSISSCETIPVMLSRSPTLVNQA
jgi:hypothetical protein